MKNVVYDLPGELLWKDGAPGAKGTAPEDCPVLSPFLPWGKGTGRPAVVVCPGGAYLGLANDHEGKQIAEWLNALGICAFVLRYRLAPMYGHPAPMLDVQRAIRMVRARAEEWGVDPGRIGVWGFSAGGHLAATASTHYDAGDPSAADPIDRVSCRPDFSILCYPVITMDEKLTHMGTRMNLIGKNPTPELVDLMSCEKQVTSDTPPTFIFVTNDDSAELAENSAVYYIALRRAGVPAEMHIYAHGAHGLGLASKDPVLRTWGDRLFDWLRGLGMV